MMGFSYVISSSRSCFTEKLDCIFGVTARGWMTEKAAVSVVLMCIALVVLASLPDIHMHCRLLASHRVSNPNADLFAGGRCRW